MEVERQNQISNDGKRGTVKKRKEGESNRKGKRMMKRVRMEKGKVECRNRKGDKGREEEWKGGNQEGRNGRRQEVNE